MGEDLCEPRLDIFVYLQNRRHDELFGLADEHGLSCFTWDATELNALFDGLLNGPALFPLDKTPRRPEFALPVLEPVNILHPHFEYIGFEFLRRPQQQAPAAAGEGASSSPAATATASAGASAEPSGSGTGTGSGSGASSGEAMPSSALVGFHVAVPMTHFKVAGQGRYVGQVDSERDADSVWILYIFDKQRVWDSCANVLKWRVTAQEAATHVGGLIGAAPTPAAPTPAVNPQASNFAAEVESEDDDGQASATACGGSIAGSSSRVASLPSTPLCHSTPHASPRGSGASLTASGSGGRRWNATHKSKVPIITSSKPVEPTSEAERRVMIDALREARQGTNQGDGRTLAVYRSAAALYEQKVTLYHSDPSCDAPEGLRPNRTTGVNCQPRHRRPSQHRLACLVRWHDQGGGGACDAYSLSSRAGARAPTAAGRGQW